MTAPPHRDPTPGRREAYERLLSLVPEPGTRAERCRAFVDAAWAALSPTGVSWLGFYAGPGESPDDASPPTPPDAMLLGPSRNTPACSPIGLHGACGRAWRTGRSLVVRDVEALGAGYIACDPRDRSEVVVPVFRAGDNGRVCWGVLDLDSHEPGSFDASDAGSLHVLLGAAGLTFGDGPVVDEIG